MQHRPSSASFLAFLFGLALGVLAFAVAPDAAPGDTLARVDPGTATAHPFHGLLPDEPPRRRLVFHPLPERDEARHRPDDDRAPDPS
ncbi:MAG TPA: hypothetical protein RMH99_30005 [Sandaracinaceae bacterium LLY-WYZ-13_1]|nr:hypothetical protein [Sandaracinaceae bacterium LLY-WYZ-13_1]